MFKLVHLSQTWLAFSLQHNNRLHNVTVYNTFLGFWISQYAFLSVLETSIWGIKLIGSLPKQILVYEHRVLFWYCNETKNHPATAIQSMDMGDSILLRYLFILVHMQLISKIGCMVGNWICSVQQVMCLSLWVRGATFFSIFEILWLISRQCKFSCIWYRRVPCIIRLPYVCPYWKEKQIVAFTDLYNIQLSLMIIIYQNI